MGNYKAAIKKLENKQNLKKNIISMEDNVSTAKKNVRGFLGNATETFKSLVLNLKNGCVKVVKLTKSLYRAIKRILSSISLKINKFNRCIKEKIKQRKKNKILYIESKKLKEIVVESAPKSHISEEFRTLRTNLQFMNSNGDLKVILVTSTTQKEGKSYTSANLAATFAQTGKKVVIVDADMRKGRQHEIFEIEKYPGLSNYLSGIVAVKTKKNIIDTFIKETQIEGLYILPMGNTPPNPSELISSKKMDDLIVALKENFDIIIFDGTPSSIVTDSVILSRKVDTTIIVSAHSLTKIDELKKVEREITNVGGKIAGVIINKIPVKAKMYSNSYYYESNKKKKNRFGV